MKTQDMIITTAAGVGASVVGWKITENINKKLIKKKKTRNAVNVLSRAAVTTAVALAQYSVMEAMCGSSHDTSKDQTKGTESSDDHTSD